MSVSNKRTLLEGVGLLAVIASLIFVALEVRQANQIGRLEALQSMATDWMSFGIEVATSETLPGLLADVYAGAVSADFDEADNVRIGELLLGQDHHWEMRFNQTKLGVLEPEDYSFPGTGFFFSEPANLETVLGAPVGDRNAFYGSPYHREMWPSIRSGFSEDFAAFWEQRFELID